MTLLTSWTRRTHFNLKHDIMIVFLLNQTVIQKRKYHMTITPCSPLEPCWCEWTWLCDTSSIIDCVTQASSLNVRHKLHHWLCDTSSIIDCTDTSSVSLEPGFTTCADERQGLPGDDFLSPGQTFSRLPEEAPQLTLGTNSESSDVGWLTLAGAPHSKGRRHRFSFPQPLFNLRHCRRKSHFHSWNQLCSHCQHICLHAQNVCCAADSLRLTDSTHPSSEQQRVCLQCVPSETECVFLSERWSWMQHCILSMWRASDLCEFSRGLSVLSNISAWPRTLHKRKVHLLSEFSGVFSADWRI